MSKWYDEKTDTAICRRMSIEDLYECAEEREKRELAKINQPIDIEWLRAHNRISGGKENVQQNAEHSISKTDFADNAENVDVNENVEVKCERSN